MINGLNNRYHLGAHFSAKFCIPNFLAFYLLAIANRNGANTTCGSKREKHLKDPKICGLCIYYYIMEHIF